MRRVARTSLFSLIALATSLACSSGPAANEQFDPPKNDAVLTATSRQTKFHAEKEIVEKTPIPDDVRSLILKSQPLPDECSSSPEGFDECFSASEIDLRNDDRPDLVVQAVGSAMGANVTMFYVFAGGPAGYELALNLPALELSFEEPEDGGPLEAVTGVATATKFSSQRFMLADGKYKIVDRKVEEIGGK
ncbi:MAG: hypothetical protein IPM63_12835 [Acidobacteriota bacterium]|nr:MAG: hypothetical protein IPM63_12835 [Acidobacteriota bacterium]